MKILHVVGARPNFVKIAPIYKEISARGDLEQILLHTGQHYDDEMSGIFFEEFGLPAPDVNLQVGSGTHAVQTAEVMKRLEPVLDDVEPDWTLVVGDVNSTLAATIVAVKKHLRVAHVEAGLRSFDRTMPEEINRVLTDQVANLLLTPSRDGDENLIKEGVDPSRIRFVGNVMIDTLVAVLPRAQERWPGLKSQLGLPDRFALVTMHRPANVDDPTVLTQILTELERLSKGVLPVVFPVHPRTRSRMQDLERSFSDRAAITFMDPVGYVDFLALTAAAGLVVTDSGGIQEETTYLGTPCLTVRANTERPVTITEGTNHLVSPTEIHQAALEALTAETVPGRPELWDGQAAQRIVTTISETSTPNQEI